MDFTIKKYKELLSVLKDAGYTFQTFAEFLEDPAKKAVILRHDVDEKPKNALKMAQAEFELGVCSTFYFRIVKISNKPKIIKAIAELGHEIGYHYEDLSIARGDMKVAIEQFRKNLEYFRTFYPVRTVCMHGSSMSEYDNRLIWNNYKLADFGLLGEPYLSLDYNKVFYLTDTGRCWDGGKYNVRDLVKNSHTYSFHRTDDIIRSLEERNFPQQTLLQSHTLWTDNVFEWYGLEIREFLRNGFKVLALRIPGLRKMLYRLIRIYSK